MARKKSFRATHKRMMIKMKILAGHENSLRAILAGHQIDG